MLMIFVQWTLHTNQNHLLLCHLGVRPCLCIFDTEVPAPNPWDERDPSTTQNEQYGPYPLLQRSLHYCFWPSSAAMPEFSLVVLILLPLLSLHPGSSLLEASEWICEQDCNDSENSSLFSVYDIGDVCVLLLPTLVSCVPRLQQHKHILSCVFQYCGGFHHFSLSVFCKALLLAPELPNFYERLWLWAWILLRLVQWRIFISIVWHCSSFGFSIVHLCFAFCFAASDICLHKSGHTLSGREVVCFLGSPLPRPCLSFWWPFVQ